MTEVDSQCLRKGTTRMPQKILKQLLQTERQGNGTGAALCVYPLTKCEYRQSIFCILYAHEIGIKHRARTPHPRQFKFLSTDG